MNIIYCEKCISRPYHSSCNLCIYVYAFGPSNKQRTIIAISLHTSILTVDGDCAIVKKHAKMKHMIKQELPIGINKIKNKNLAWRSLLRIISISLIKLPEELLLHIVRFVS